MFDSGVGGLAVLAEVHRLLPAEDIVYVADAARFPYGSRPAVELRERASEITRALLARGAKLIVVACNTATSAAIAALRAGFDVPVVGMEPALKPAAERTLAGRVALLVTPGTAKGEKLAALVDRYGAEVHVETVAAAGLAEAVERGDSTAARDLVRRYLDPVRRSGADVVALGCTHYAFLRPMIEDEAGQGIAVIEPSDAVARQVQRVLAARALLNRRAEAGGVLYLTSGDPQALETALARLRAGGTALPEGEVMALEGRTASAG
jgi:glutamate racemase